MKKSPGCAVLWALMLAPFLLPAGMQANDKPAPGDYLMYVGTYTEHGSKGIYAYRYDSVSGRLTPLGLAAETENPSFVAASPNGKFLYAVNELGRYEGQSSGAVTAFAIDHATGKLTSLNEVASKGADPCYLTLDRTGKYLLVANYTGGSVAAFPVQNDGRLGSASDFIQHQGSGVNPKRQEGPHAHSVDLSADNRFAVVADLGLDELLVYRFDASKGTLALNDPPFAKLAGGLGPRHFAFHPDGKFAYVLTEMGSKVVSFSYDKNAAAFHELQTISALPKDFSGENDAAEIEVHPTGRFLYTSNRGNDSIAVFAINRIRGTLTLLQIVPTQGKTPRNFHIDPSGTRLLVANQESGNIVVFAIDPKTGSLNPTGQVIEVPSPVCIRFAKSPAGHINN